MLTAHARAFILAQPDVSLVVREVHGLFDNESRLARRNISTADSAAAATATVSATAAAAAAA
eukprot:CAMPEP_0181392986 /NCGR_PEP_ID=MMETSP1106-20121128/26909_1 /TAXON_ID=81844 /ORGANISM="Mantoniella antarctica, Strain SL-175" /LENGTH=61 /DNA_ID=CAMNT_0023514197 /DNA_START=272 /DNA_END=453 /DNA_ORIENTATION=+